jgi:anthranilate synthase component 1
MPIQKSDLANLASQGFNSVPLMREVLADLDTPVSTYLKLANGPYSYLLESVHGGEKWGRYSIIGLPCRTVLRVWGNELQVIHDNEVTEQQTVDDPLAAVAEFQQRYQVPEIDGLPRFTGGVVGYFGYDTVRYIETHLGPSHKPDPVQAPDIMLMVSEDVLVFDNLTGRLHVITHVDPADSGSWKRGNRRLDELIADLRGVVTALIDSLPRRTH